MEERTFEDIINVLYADEEWDMPADMRPAVLEGLAWIFNQL